MAASSPAAASSLSGDRSSYNNNNMELPNLERMSFLDCPNTEEYHTTALAKSKQIHDSVRERAILVLRTKADEEEADRLRLQANELEQQVDAEERKAAEAIRIREAENRRKQIPQPPPRVPTPPPQVAPRAPTPPPPQKPSPVQPAAVKAQSPFSPAITTPTPPPPQPVAPRAPPPQFALQPPAQQPAPPAKPQSSPFQQPQQSKSPAVQPPSQPNPPAPQSQDNARHILPDADRLVAIHNNLKKLRAFILTQETPISREQVRQRDGSMKVKQITVRSIAGEMRRALTRTMGQLTDVAGSNSKQIVTIRELLEKSLTIDSAPMQPQHFMCDPPQGPVEGTQNNGDMMPSLFLYLLNIFTKAIVNQLSSEASTNPKIAEPIGIVAHTIISHPKFLWRGQSFIGIIMAKFRLSIPVVFGVRGSETTEQGRARLGWRKGDNGWLSDQEHQDRMRGLGAGYAALCLRNYSKSARVNPWPPSHYWNAMALLVSTPPAERSTTQVIVLTAMLDGYERKFLEFYGDMARSAMRAAIVDFPSSTPEKTSAIQGLSVLGDKIKRDLGLSL
ncbi:hypothetical protein VTL71DRAFT_16576 [Oculimacula yallundae]|uniref:mRNA export factor GLE1 n=1 Tax=Oculimacula yallundae TaxID=86028 RepID=A0ABR4CEU4_9HELO